jgi:hypothetical protein
MMSLQRQPLIALCLSMALMGLTANVHAEGATASSPAKKELVNRLLTLQRGVVEGLAENLVQQPASQLLQQADMALQTRVPADKREEVGKGIKADVRKFLEETTPIVKSKAIQVAPSTIGAMLEEKFSEDELKQLIAILESPVNRRLNEMGPEMQRALTDKLLAESRPEVEPKIRELQSNLAKRFVPSSSTPPASQPSPAKAENKSGTASKPTGK